MTDQELINSSKDRNTSELTGAFYTDRFFEKNKDWGVLGWTVGMIVACGAILVVMFVSK